MVKTGCLESQRRGFVPRSGPQLSRKQNISFPLTRKESVLWGASVTREVASSAADRQASNFESCVWRVVSSHSSHYPQEVFLTLFSLYVHKGG